MNSKRIQAIASLVDANEVILDMGTDHAYLPIYLIKSKGYQKVYASDISANVLKQAIKSIEKYGLTDKVTLYESDGFKNINKDFTLVIIAGMGTNTIIKIIEEAQNLPSKFIIQSNNNLPILREYMQNKGYKIKKEMVIYEKGKYYPIISYERKKDNLTKDEINYGKSYDKEYLSYLAFKYENIYKMNKAENTKKYLENLKKFIEKIPD